MRNCKKIKFSDITGMLEKDEMKEILGGSGGIMYSCGAGDYSNGILSPSIPMSSSNNGWGGGNIIGTTVGGVAYNTGSSSNGNSSSGSGSSYTNNTYGSSSYNVGWNNNRSGLTTNDPFAINRFFNFLASNNGNVSNSQVQTFMATEFSLPKEAVPLNNVTVSNNYKGPSTIPSGVIYNNGILEISNSYYNGGGTSNGGSSSNISLNGTKAILVPFTKEEIVNGFSKINFSGMVLESIPDWDPVKSVYNYQNSFQPTMKLNVDGAIAIALYEKLSLTVYDKDSNIEPHTTIGFGHKLHDGLINSSDPKSISFDQAISYLARDIIEKENILNKKIENLDLTGTFNRNQYFALLDMTFNGGNNKDSIVSSVLNAMKSGGVKAANDTITNAYLNETNGGVKDRRYFEAQAFVNGRCITPDQADTELKNLGLKK